MIRNNYIYIYIYARNTWIAEPRKAPGGGKAIRGGRTGEK